jgi:hypothetical protein
VVRSLLLQVSVAALLLLGLTGCETYTCEGACDQYYGADGCGRPSVRSDGTSSEDASDDCATECTTALYTTLESPGGTDDRNYRVLQSQSDALAFINCVVEQDYSEAAFNATCEDLQHQCAWFRW